MRFRTRKRCRSCWGVFCCALLLVGAYLLFDVLDVDGSQARWLSPCLAVAAENSADRLRFALPDPASLVSSVLPAAPAPGGAERLVGRLSLTCPHPRIFSRVQRTVQSLRGTSLTTDPV